MVTGRTRAWGEDNGPFVITGSVGILGDTVDSGTLSFVVVVVSVVVVLVSVVVVLVSVGRVSLSSLVDFGLPSPPSGLSRSPPRTSRDFGDVGHSRRDLSPSVGSTFSDFSLKSSPLARGNSLVNF